MTKNKLTDLNNHLFAQLERLGEDNLTTEDIEREMKRTESIVQLSEQIIDNAQVSLAAAKLIADKGIGNWEQMLPELPGKPAPRLIEGNNAQGNPKEAAAKMDFSK